MDVRVTKEIKEIKGKVFWGLNLRQTLSLVSVVAVALILYALLGDKLQKDILGIIIVICCLPIGAVGFVKIQGMPFEKYALEWIQSFIFMKKELYNEPKNTYEAFANAARRNDPENVKKRAKETQKKSLIMIIIIALLFTILISLFYITAPSRLENTKQESIATLEASYDPSCYQDEEIGEIKAIVSEAEGKILSATSDDELTEIMKTYGERVSQVKTYGQIMADRFETNMMNPQSAVYSSQSLQEIMKEEKVKIAQAKGKDEVMKAYDDAVDRIEAAVKSGY